MALSPPWESWTICLWSIGEMEGFHVMFWIISLFRSVLAIRSSCGISFVPQEVAMPGMSKALGILGSEQCTWSQGNWERLGNKDQHCGPPRFCFGWVILVGQYDHISRIIRGPFTVKICPYRYLMGTPRSPWFANEGIPPAVIFVYQISIVDRTASMMCVCPSPC